MYSSRTDSARLLSNGEYTPPTQWATCLLVTLRIDMGVVLAGGGAVPACGDAVPDGDLLGSDEDVLDQQPQYPLAFGDGGGGGLVAELGEEAFAGGGAVEGGLRGGWLGGGGGELGVHALFPRRQTRAP